MAPHHRRRRAIAIAAVLGISLLVVLGIVLLTGGGAAAPRPTVEQPHGGFFATIRELAGGGAASLTAREARAENAAINRTLAYTPYVRIAGAQHREIALTFDDGPGPYTPQVLAVLQREHVPATFFEVGIEERYFNASTDRDRRRRRPDRRPHRDPRRRCRGCRRPSSGHSCSSRPARSSATARSFPRLFRPPYGLWNAATLALLHRYRMLMVLWTVDTNDYLRPGVDSDRRPRRPWGEARRDHPAPRRRRRSVADRRGAAEDHRGAAAAPLPARDRSEAAAGQPGAARPEHRSRDRVWGISGAGPMDAGLLGGVGPWTREGSAAWVHGRRRARRRARAKPLSAARRRRGSSSARARAGSARRHGRAGCR